MQQNNLIYQEILLKFENIIDLSNILKLKYTIYKDLLSESLRSTNAIEVTCALYLVEELGEGKIIDFLEPLFEIFVYDLGMSFRVKKIFNNIDREIILVNLKELVCIKKESMDYESFNIIINFYKDYDLDIAIFLCNVFKQLNDSDINDEINDFLKSLE